MAETKILIKRLVDFIRSEDICESVQKNGICDRECSDCPIGDENYSQVVVALEDMINAK